MSLLVVRTESANSASVLAGLVRVRPVSTNNRRRVRLVPGARRGRLQVSRGRG